MRDFKQLKIWERSHKLTLDLYRVTAGFPKVEQYGLTNQIRRACASIPANIAEGCGHQSEAEFARYLQLAMSSASELDYHLILARDLGYFDPNSYECLASELQ
jgi:four helix bundle protein